MCCRPQWRCGRTIAVNTVGAGAKYGDCLSGNPGGANQRKLLVAATSAAIFDLYRDFSSRDQADAFGFLVQLAQTIQQIFSGALVIPVIAAIVYFHGKTVTLSLHLRRFQERGVRQKWPPASSMEGQII